MIIRHWSRKWSGIVASLFSLILSSPAFETGVSTTARIVIVGGVTFAVAVFMKSAFNAVRLDDERLVVDGPIRRRTFERREILRFESVGSGTELRLVAQLYNGKEARLSAAMPAMWYPRRSLIVAGYVSRLNRWLSECGVQLTRDCPQE